MRLLAFFCLLLAGLIDSGLSDFIPQEPPRGRAIYTPKSPVVDGLLGSEEWKRAERLVAKGQRDSDTFTTRVLWNREGVYLAFDAVDQTPIWGHSAKGAPLFLEDVFEVFIDQKADHLQYYEIQVDPAGQTYFRNNVLTAPPRLTSEGRLTQEFVESDIWRYDMAPPDGFKVASHYDAKTGHWTLEMFLPASFVNYRRGGIGLEPCTWRINLARHDWDKETNASTRVCRYMYWSPVLDGHPHISPKAMGYLELAKP